MQGTNQVTSTGLTCLAEKDPFVPIDCCALNGKQRLCSVADRACNA